MPVYRRTWVPGGTYFFTHNLMVRRKTDLLVRHIHELRDAVRHVRRQYPFLIDAWCVLPDHMHCVITLPPGDKNFPLRMRLIKAGFSRRIPDDTSWKSASRNRRSYRAVWQHRYWEHLIQDEEDFRRHVDYVHVNPLKHGLVQRVQDWPYSTFHRDVGRGIYPVDWAGDDLMDLMYSD